MQGERSSVGSLPDPINFDYESPTTNVGIDQQNFWNSLGNPAESRLPDYRISSSYSDGTYIGGANPEGQNFGLWNVGDSISASPLTLVGDDERSIPIGIGLRLDVQQHEPASLVSQSAVNLNLSTNQIITAPTFVRGSSSNSASQNYDSNVARFHRMVDEMECHNSSKSIGFENKFHLSAGTSSDPFGSSSGSGGFFVEDDDGRPGCSLDGRRLSCKRKTLEGNASQSSSGGSFFVGESSSNVAPPEQVNPGLGLGMGERICRDNIRPLSLSGGPESSQRNYRSRACLPIQQDSESNNSFLPVPASVTRHPNIPSVHQPLRFVTIDPPSDLISPIQLEASAPQNQSTALRTPTMRRNLQPHRWNSLRPGNSSSSTLSGERDVVLLDNSSSRNMPRNIGEHPMFAPPVEARNSGSHPTHWSLHSGSVGISRTAGSSSRSGSNIGPHSSVGRSWDASHHHSPSQYSRRLSEYVRRSLMSTVGSDVAGQSSSNSQHRSVPASSQDGGLPSSGGNQGQNQSQSRSALWMERQGEGAGGNVNLRALAAAGEGRSRIVSEIRNALDILRRGEGLRIEDVMLLDQSVFLRMADIHDQHRDMRLDVDNMSYEELLALEERIGYVSTGMSEEMILKCMKQCKHAHTMSDDLTEAEPCCVCQEEYRDGEDIGILDCGHDFHKECIKQWLVQKNLCPICKTTGLATK